MQWIYAILVWFGFAVMAIAVAMVRIRVAEPRIGKQAAHVVFTILFSLLLYGCIAAFMNVADFSTPSSQWTLGIVWTAMTTAFEFLFGHYVAGHSWATLFADYNVFRGRIWVLVLLTTLLGPRLAGM